MPLNPWIKGVIILKKPISVLWLLMFSFLLLGGCSAEPINDSNANHKQDSLVLTDEQAITNAKMLNKKYNLDMDKIFNLSYQDSKAETDGYNRYIVQLVYQYENSNRQLRKNDILFYFTYDPKTEKISSNRICFWDTYNFGIGDKDGWAYLKNNDEFSWGIDPATLTMTNDMNDNSEDSGDNSDHKTLTDYMGKSIDGNVGEIVTVTGTIAQNSGIFPTWCIELDGSLYFRATYEDGNAAYFDCDKLFFYDEDNLDEIPFSAWESEVITVSGILENYRNGGELFLYEPSLIP